jgi:hypothetical protein
MRSLPVLLVIAIVASACQSSSITISLGQPTPTSTWTPTPAVDAQATAAIQAATTATAQAQATTNARATADAQATANAQAIGTATTQARATATARAQATATAQAQATATARIQATVAAQAAATATTQALIAAINTMVDSAPGKPFVVREETVGGQPAPYVTLYNPKLFMQNFAAEVQFFNPADLAVHPWDFGFLFRAGDIDQYRLVIQSSKIWYLILIDQGLADAVDGKLITQGVVSNLNLDKDGSNTFRLVVKDKSAFLFINNQYIVAMDVSARSTAGSFYLGTAMGKGANFPGLKLYFKNLSVKGLP